MSRWISSRANEIEERYNMLHGEHGLFAVGTSTEEKLKGLAPAQRDTLARGVEDCAGRLRATAATQGKDSAKALHAVADKVDAAAAHLRAGEFKEAKTTLATAAVNAATAGYPGIAEDVTTTGSNWLAQLTGTPNPPSYDELLDKNVGKGDLPKSGYLSGIDFGTLG